MIQQFQQFLRMFKVALIFTLISSVSFTYMGLTEEYGSAESWSTLRPLLQSVLSMMISFVGWCFFLSIIPIAKPHDLKKLWAGLCIFLILLLSTSTYYGSIGIAGSQARHHVMIRGIEVAEKTFITQIRQRREVEALLPPVISAKNVFESTVRRERKGGALSGLRGSGKVTSSIQGLVDGCDRVEKTINTDLRQTDRYYEKGVRLLDDLRIIATDRTLTTNEKNDRIGTIYMELRRLHMDLEKSILPSIVSEVERLDSLYLMESDDEIKQVFAILEKPIAESKAMILEIAAKIRHRPVPIPQFRIVGSLEAVMMTPMYSYPSLVFALASDFLFPLGMLMILYFLASGIRRPSGGMRSGGTGSHRVPPQRPPAMPVRPPVPVYAAKEQTSSQDGGNGKDHNGGNGKVQTPNQSTDFQV